MNIDLRKKPFDFEKDFFRLMNNAVFGKTTENARKHKNIKLVSTESRRNYLVSEPNYHITNVFTEYLLVTEMKKMQKLMNKPVYLGLSILELSKVLMYEFWYDYVKLKYDEESNLCYMDTDSFFVYIKTDDISKDIAEDVETRFDTSNYEFNRPLSKVKNRKVIGLTKEGFGGKIMIKFVGLRVKYYSYGSEDKKVKGTKKHVIKRKLKFENFKNYLEATQLENKTNHQE